MHFGSAEGVSFKFESLQACARGVWRVRRKWLNRLTQSIAAPDAYTAARALHQRVPQQAAHPGGRLRGAIRATIQHSHDLLTNPGRAQFCGAPVPISTK